MGLTKQNTSNSGLVPQIVNNLFLKIDKEQSSNYEISISFLELYNNKIIDVIPKIKTKNSKKELKPKKLEILSLSGVTYVKDLELVHVTSSDQLPNIVQDCCKLRIINFKKSTFI